MLHALVIEDDPRHASVVADALRGLAQTQHVDTADEALAALLWVVPDVVLTDVRGVSHASPLEHIASLRIALDAAGDRARVRSPIPLVLGSAVDPAALRELAELFAHTHTLPKPFSPSTLRALVARLTGESP